MMDEAQVRELVRKAVDKALPAAAAAAPPPVRAGSKVQDRPKRRRVVSEEDVREAVPGQRMDLPPDAVVTPLARALARERGVAIGGEPVARRESSSTLRSPGRVVALGADHGGFVLKEDLKAYVKSLGYLVKDCGTGSEQAVDYPDFALAVAAAVASQECWRGIMIDGAGIGSCMVANKVPGVRAASCYDLASAKNSREHNDATVLTLGARMITADLARHIVKVFLETACTEDRHLRRVHKIMDVERRFLRR